MFLKRANDLYAFLVFILCVYVWAAGSSALIGGILLHQYVCSRVCLYVFVCDCGHELVKR